MASSSVRIEFILVYVQGFEVPGPDAEIPDAQGYYYHGLKAFTEALVAPAPNNLLDTIKQRNEDVYDIQYLGLLGEPDAESHVFKIILDPITDQSPLYPLEDEDWDIDFGFISAYYSLLDRIFWTPPSLPRIKGEYSLIGEYKVTVGGTTYTSSIPIPFGGGGGGGMK